MKRKSFLVIICLYGQLISGCRQTPHPPESAPQVATNKSAHTVIQVDWRAELAGTQEKLTRDPNSAFLHNQAAAAYDALGDFENFEREIQMAMKLDPENSIHCYIAYAVYKRRHLKDKQVSVLDRALQIDPANPFGHYEKAYILEDNKDWPNALKEYQTTQELLKWVTSDPGNLSKNGWTYLDRRGNPYDVTWEASRIPVDIARVREAIRNEE